MNTPDVQKAILANKIAKGFNVTDIPLEFAYLYSEVGEAFEAWRKKKDDLGEELADVAIYLLGMAEISGIDLESEIIHKMAKNAKREYEHHDGVSVRVSGE
jgi:NTP pyrophosphatase (non-canonical NTP hydrolase)